MTLVKWKPKRDIFNFIDDIDQMFRQTFGHPLETEGCPRYLSPFMNVNETDSEYTVTMDLPGVDKKDVQVNMSGGVITVAGERKKRQQEGNNPCIWQETFNGKYRRSFELSNSVQEEKIKAHYKNGVLILTIPKFEDALPELKNIAVS